MEKVIINTPGARSEILVGVKWKSVTGLLPEKGVVILTDENVKKYYGDSFPQFPVLCVTPGEDSKKLEVVEQLAEKLLEAGIDRNGFVLSIGGGVVCDLGGFLASVYMRGIRCGYVSTSLLSQVDASTGGKNGVNLGGTKNVLGNIRQPEFVVCDAAMLKTLSEQEYLSGMAELIKTAIIGDKELFGMLEQRHDEIMNRDYDLLTTLVARSVRFKAAIVSEDERENGKRRILNFGHTYGHAIEMQLSVKHGFAIAAGMEIATEYSFERGFISLNDKNRILGIMKQYGLQTDHSIPDDRIEQLILHDKKKSGPEIYFVFTSGIGNAIVNKVETRDVVSYYKKFRDKK